MYGILPSFRHWTATIKIITLGVCVTVVKYY